MSVFANVAGEGLERTSGGFLDLTADFSILLWIRPTAAIPGAATSRAFWVYRNTAYTAYLGIFQRDTGSIEFFADDGAAGTASIVFSTDGATTFNKDYPIAVVYVASTNTFTFYVKNETVGTDTLDISGLTIDDENLLFDGGTPWTDLAGCAVREFQRALTADEIKIEWSEFAAVDAQDLFLDCPLVSDLDDISGNNRDFAAVGSTTFVTGGPLNQYTYTPRIIDAIPYSVSAQQCAGSVEGNVFYDVYWQYEPVDAVVLSMLPTLSAGNLATLTILDDGVAAPNGTATNTKVKYWEYLPGSVWQLRFNKVATATFPATLAIDLIEHVDLSIPVGSLAITDDGGPFPTAFISATDATYTIRAYGPELTHGEQGFSMSTGVVLISDSVGVVYNIDVHIYDGANDYALLGTILHVEYVFGVDPDHYYGNSMLSNVGPDYYVKFDETGAILDSWMTGSELSGFVPRYFCVDNDQQYLVFQRSGGTPAFRLYRIDLAADTLSAAIFSYSGSVSASEFVVTADNTMVFFVVYNSGARSGEQEWIELDFDGNVIRTFDIGVVLEFGLRVCRGVDPDHLWVWEKNADGSGRIQTFYQIEISSGTVIFSIAESFLYDKGIPSTLTQIPEANAQRFGNSDSCPLWVTRAGDTPPGTIIVEKIVVPSTDLTSFDFTTTGLLIPSAFSLQHGGSRIFSDLAPEEHYGVAETPNPAYTTVVEVSNASPADNIALAEGETVTVTFTNTAIVPAGPPGCPIDDPDPVTGDDGCPNAAGAF